MGKGHSKHSAERGSSSNMSRISNIAGTAEGITDLDDIFSQWAQDKLGKKYNELVAVDTKELSITKDKETYQEEDLKEKVITNTSNDTITNDNDTSMDREISDEEKTKYSCQWSQTKGFRLSADVSVTVGLPAITGLTAKLGAQFHLSRTKTEMSGKEESHGHKTTVSVPPRSKVHISIRTKKKVQTMTFSLEVSLQGTVSVQMRKKSGKIKTAKGNVVDIFQKCGKVSTFTIDEDSNGKKRVHLTIEGMFEGVRTIDSEVHCTNEEEDVFKNSVKNYYEVKLTTFKPLIWNDQFSLKYSEIFTGLELIEKHKHKVKMDKGNIGSAAVQKNPKSLNSLDDVLNPSVTGQQKPPRCILIEGEAGGGKTTFLSKEALDAVSQKTELGRRHDIVLLIRLREVREGETIEEVVWDQCVPEIKGINAESIESILQRNESRVLFLLDGYDELRPDAGAPGQAIPKLLSGKMYPNSTIVITSRPSAGVQQYTWPDCHVHIMGFSHEDVVEYIWRYFSVVGRQEITETLVVLLDCNELLSSLIRTPMFLLLVCVLWEEDQEMVSTGTMTGLYSNLLTCLVRKYCKREGVDMPTDGLPAEVADALLQFGKLALGALLRNETLLDLAQVEREDVNWQLLMKLGVVSLEVSASKLHPRKQLNFSHKTMQEFLAGRYVAHAVVNQDIVELLQLTSVNKALELRNLLQFTSGCDSRAAQEVMRILICLRLKQFPNLRAEQLEDSHVPIARKDLKPLEMYVHFVALYVKILSERQEPEVLKYFIQALPIVTLNVSVNSREAAALKYYLQHLKSTNLPDRLILIIRDKDSKDTVQYLQQCFTSPLAGLKVDLELSAQFDSPDQTARLVSVLENVPILKALSLSQTYLTPSSLRPLVRGFSHMSLLEALDLSENTNLGDAGMEVLQAGLSNIPHLPVLRLWRVLMTAVGMSSLAPYMRHLAGLRELDISFNKIGDAGLESLTTVLPTFTAMQVLVLRFTGISSTGMCTLVPALRQLTRLITLDISYNRDIRDHGLQCLAHILPLLAAMKVLHLSRTGISDRGISALVKALPHLVELQELNVSDNNIGDSGIVSLVQTLCQPSSLDTGHNPPGDKGLTTAPHYNTTLQELNIRGNRGVTGAGLGRVAQLIGALQALTELHMSGDYNTPAHLSDTAAMALAETLPRHLDLERLGLRHISMGPSRFQAVVQAAEEHPTLERLWYSKDRVPEGADTSASCLRLV